MSSGRATEVRRSRGKAQDCRGKTQACRGADKEFGEGQANRLMSSGDPAGQQLSCQQEVFFILSTNLWYQGILRAWYNDLIRGRKRPNGHPYHVRTAHMV